MGERLGTLQRSHLLLLPSAEKGRRLVRRHLVACQSLQDVAAEFRRLALSSTILAAVANRRPIRQPERPNQRVDAGPNGGVRNLQLALEFLGVAPGPKEPTLNSPSIAVPQPRH